MWGDTHIGGDKPLQPEEYNSHKMGYDIKAIDNVVKYLEANYDIGKDYILHKERGVVDPTEMPHTIEVHIHIDDPKLEELLSWAIKDEDEEEEDYPYGVDPESGDPLTKEEYEMYLKWTRDRVVDAVEAYQKGDMETASNHAWNLMQHGIGLSSDDLNTLNQIINKANE